MIAMHWLTIGAIGLVALVATPALAFPPTATTSPGYDRALAESRKARQMAPPFVAPAPPSRPNVKRRHVNRH